MKLDKEDMFCLLVLLIYVSIVIVPILGMLFASVLIEIFGG